MADMDAGTHSTAQAPKQRAVALSGPLCELARELLELPPAAAPADLPAPDQDWAVAPLPAGHARRQIELLTAADARAIDTALAAEPDAVLVDADALRYADAGQLEAAFGALHAARQAHPEAPLGLRLRPATLLQPVQQADMPALPAGLVDLLLALAAPAPAQATITPLPLQLELSGVRDGQQAAQWAQWLAHCEQALDLPRGALRLSLRVDTLALLGALDEALWALRERVVALRLDSAAVLGDLIAGRPPAQSPLQADRAQALDLAQPWADALSKRVCVQAHRRGVLSLSGLLPALPVRDDAQAQAEIEAELAEGVRALLRNGHDGVTLAHSHFVPAAREACAEMMPTANQSERPLDWAIDPALIAAGPTGEITDGGLRHNLGVAIQALAAALRGQGRLPLYNLMEEPASASLCWLQVWLWVQHPEARLADGRAIDADLFEGVLREELDNIRMEREPEAFARGHYEHAAALLQRLCLGSAVPTGPQDLEAER